jgi:cell division septal protein FtsQ
MSAVTAPADKRFRRSHVKPGRRRRWYAFLLPVGRYALITAASLFAVYYGATAVTHASVLAIDDIAVDGNQHLATNEILRLLDGLKGENLLVSDLDAWREQLIASPWVKDATFRRSLPSSVRVTVQERVPIGLGRIRGRLYLVDERGEVSLSGPAYAGSIFRCRQPRRRRWARAEQRAARRSVLLACVARRRCQARRADRRRR